MSCSPRINTRNTNKQIMGNPFAGEIHSSGDFLFAFLERLRRNLIIITVAEVDSILTDN